jgi:probable HAF family extracellular repeat protein
MVAGISQTGQLDTLGEGWSCEDGGFLPVTTPKQVCRGFFWNGDHLLAMPTLGGTHSFATGINNRGQVVGWAELGQRDPSCVGVQQLGFQAVVWEPLRGRLRRLRPFPGHSASAATAINERGQAVGISGDCDQAVGRFTARKAALWDGRRLIEIPNLGGVSWHTPMDINERGDVVGFSNPPGAADLAGEFVSHAFYWRRGSDKAVDIGVLDGDALSEAFGINNRGQVVGVSFGGTAGSRAFIYQDGTLANLNDLVDVAPNILQSAQHINDAGQITGRLRDVATGQVLTFVATPRGEDRH